MSGGVDSSVAAALLLRQAYDVVGCFMRLGSPGEAVEEFGPDGPAASAPRIGKQGCCSINDAADARLVAARLGIPLYVCNFKRDFGRIIDYFADEYAAGRTPNPCVRCNDWLKFGKLHEYARSIGAEFVASGHYARIEQGTDGPALLRGVDGAKDQSYVLFGASRESLARMMLPIGELEKPAVREIARGLGLCVGDKPDSQEICFVPDNDYAGLVERRRALAGEGDILDEAGAVVGRHAGQHRYTIGQRRGLEIALGRRVFVTGRDAATNTVTVGPRGALLRRSCIASEANWLIDPPRGWLDCLAQERAHASPGPARVRVIDGAAGATPSGRTGRFEVEFDPAREAVAPGQAIVLYSRERPERVLGGGWIVEARA